MSKPLCFEPMPNPADELAMFLLWSKAVEVALRLGPGRRAEVIVERGRNGRITGRVVEHHFPCEDEAA